MDLVVGASTDTMKSVMGKLGNLLAQEYALISGVRGDIQYINDELASMQAFLLDLARDGQDNRKKDWMKQIRDMAYDCEDCIDNFAHRLPNDPKFDGKCCSWSWIVTIIHDLRTYFPRREIASCIAELKARAHLIAERRTRYGVENPKTDGDKDSGTSADTNDIAEHQLANRQLIGLTQPVGVDLTELENWVNNPDEKELAVLCIVGFGGVGKTTVAMALYRKVMSKFECRASVTVSQNYVQRAVLMDILRQVQPQGSTTGTTGNGMMTKAAHIRSKLKRTLTLRQSHTEQDRDESSNVKQMDDKEKDELKMHLGNKRYIILVDDIWSAITWNEISRSLPDGEKGSRIIVTSRFQAVGGACSSTKGKLYTIDFLSPDNSKKLFDQSVTESCMQSHNVHNNQVPEDLWRRCGGQPLAIVTMAGLVACNQNKLKSDWGKLCKSLPEPEQESSITSDGVQKQVISLTLNGVTRILDCCYNDLRGDLKTCLLYLCIFPKGWKISRKCLTRRWIAEGFVSEKQGLTEEEVAETYFNQILRRKLIRPVEHSSNGKVKKFQVHDMVLDYVVSKAREENFITVVGGHWMMPTPNNKVRRLSMQRSDSTQKDLTKDMNLSQMRSLTIFGSLAQVPFKALNNRIIQVLDLDGLKGLKEKHLNEIFKMRVLKYLSLRRTDITEIPSTIENLECLETLDIRETNVEGLPRAVEQLKLISILGGSKTPRKGLRLPQEKGTDKRKSKSNEGMKGLRILSGIEIVGESTEIASLHELTGLKKLAIYKLSIDPNKDTSRVLRSAIEYLCSCGLQTLAINDEGSDFLNSLDGMSAPPRFLIALELSGALERPPKWIENLHKLEKLTMSVTVLQTGTLKLLCNLNSLFSLTFSLRAQNQDDAMLKILDENRSQSDGEIFVPGGGFRRLKLFRIFAPRVPKLGFSHNAMPELEMIEMRFAAFEGLFGIDTLKNLKGVHLREDKTGKRGDDAEINEILVRHLKETFTTPKVIDDHTQKVIVDHTFTS